MKTFSRRQFISLAICGAAATPVLFPGLVRSTGSPSPIPPNLPYVSVLSKWSVYTPTGSPMVMPGNVPASDAAAVMAAINATPNNGGNWVAKPGTVPSALAIQAVQAWSLNNQPAGYGAPVPQLVFWAGVAVAVVVLAVGGFIVYWIWKLVKSIPPPDTNVYR